MIAMKTLSHGFGWLRRLAFVVLLMGIAGHALAAKTYADNGDGTVTDLTTGLVWMRCEMGKKFDGKTCTGTASAYNFDQANALTGTTSFANHSDWRLPNISELQTIVDRSSIHVIDAVAFPGTNIFTYYFYFWSASAVAGNSNDAWYVSFSGGEVESDNKASYRHVLLVRAGRSLNILGTERPTSDYVDHSDGTVTHIPTGLMWQRCAVGQTLSSTGGCTGTAGYYTWDQAKALSSSLGGLHQLAIAQRGRVNQSCGLQRDQSSYQFLGIY